METRNKGKRNNNFKHGETVGRKKSTEFQIWHMMRRRCNSPTNDKYKSYGGRGIKVCDRWNESFLNFLEDMGRRPSMQHTLDRRDNDGNYCKENCRWATIDEQMTNRQNTVYIEYENAKIPLVVICKQKNISYSAVLRRIKRGWAINKAIEKPMAKQNNIKQTI